MLKVSIIILHIDIATGSVDMDSQRFIYITTLAITVTLITQRG